MDTLSRLPKKDQETFKQISRALHFAKYYHGPTQRQSGVLYYTHPMEVAMHTMRYSKKPSVWIAALLHDVLEDSHATLEEIGIVFGTEVRELVKRLSAVRFSSKKYKVKDAKEAFAPLFHAGPDAQLIKLCDRLHNLQTLDAMPIEKQRAKVQETLTFLVPLAEKIGQEDLAEALRELCGEYQNDWPEGLEEKIEKKK